MSEIDDKRLDELVDNLAYFRGYTQETASRCSPEAMREHLTEEIVTDILSGVYDSKLESVKDAVTTRWELIEQQETALLLAKIKEGDKVRLKNIKPNYLQGAICTVTYRQLKMKKNKGKLHVTLDKPVGKYSGGVNVHASCIELVEVSEDERFPKRELPDWEDKDDN